MQKNDAEAGGQQKADGGYCAEKTGAHVDSGKRGFPDPECFAGAAGRVSDL